jgi:hypothetical protein
MSGTIDDDQPIPICSKSRETQYILLANKLNHKQHVPTTASI